MSHDLATMRYGHRENRLLETTDISRLISETLSPGETEVSPPSIGDPNGLKVETSKLSLFSQNKLMFFNMFISTCLRIYAQST